MSWQKSLAEKKNRKNFCALYESGRPELAAVYGRRRVGKTFLIREMPRDSMAFCHAGLSVWVGSIN